MNKRYRSSLVALAWLSSTAMAVQPSRLRNHRRDLLDSSLEKDAVEQQPLHYYDEDTKGLPPPPPLPPKDKDDLFPTAKIVGGSIASIGEFPWFAWGYGCGGSLISPTVVLTAAHCLGAFPESWPVRVGSRERNRGGLRSKILRRLTHPRYNARSFNGYDVMLVQLETPLTNVTLASLNYDRNYPPEDEDSLGIPLQVMGFGAMSERGPGSPILLQTTLNYVNNRACGRMYNLQEDIMLCAGFAPGGRDSCQGDSGGPIIDGMGRQLGIVSFGAGCARPDTPGVYTRISGVMDWIRTNACILSNSGPKPDFCTNPPPPSVPTTTTSSAGKPPRPSDSAPTTTTTPLSVEDNLIAVTIKHDRYPEETGWMLRDKDGNVILEQPAGRFTQPDGVARKSIRVNDGTYEFELFDTFGDGICCQYGDGNAHMVINGKEASITGNFGHIRKATIKIKNGETTIDASVALQYKIDVQYDDQPEDFHWSIFDRTEGVIIKRSARVREANKLTSTLLDLKMDHQYIIDVKDHGGDGLVDGYIRVYAQVDGEEKNLRMFPGAGVGAGKRTGFRVERQYLLPKAAFSVEGDNNCSDDPEDFFHVNDAVGQQDCAWLADNIGIFKSVCQFTHVAKVCPHTCGVCSVFSNNPAQ